MLSSLLLFLLAAGAPNPTVESDLAQGRALHDAGDYDGAIRVYEALLSQDPGNRDAAYERLFSTYAKQDLAGTRKRGEEILKSDRSAMPGVYVILGSACDDAGDHDRAVSVFRKGIKKYPQVGSLHFNLGVTLAALGKLEDAAAELQESLALAPRHPASWLQLGYVAQRRHEPGYALAAFTRFLSIEPRSARSPAPARALFELLMAGISRGEPKEGKAQINVTIATEDAQSPGATQAAMLGLTGASRYLEEWENKTDNEFFVDGLQTALTILSETAAKDATGRFWKGCALDFFDAARQAGHMPAMAYDLRGSLKDAEIDGWLAAHVEEVEAYRAWSLAWKPTACAAPK